MKVPDLEELVSASEAAHALTVNSGVWNVLLTDLLAVAVREVSATHLLQLCINATPPSSTREQDGESILAYLCELYSGRYGPPREQPYVKTVYGEQCAGTYFNNTNLTRLLIDLRGDD